MNEHRIIRGIIALDLGTTTGYAVSSSLTGVITSGSIAFKTGRFEGGGMRFLRFRRWCEDFISAEKPKTVYFEEVRRHVGTDAAHVYGGMMAVLTATCEALQIPYAGVPVGTIKKHATGRGNADKNLMIEAMRSKGYDPKDDNEADAIALLLWAIDNGGGG